MFAGDAVFDRTPPQDLAAEQSVLGSMMLSKDAVSDVMEEITASDFYKPAHETVFQVIMDLYSRSEPADAVTVASELERSGELTRIGGAPYLHTLISSVPTVANAGYYARIVRERATLRGLVQAGTKIVQLGYATDGGDIENIVNEAQEEIYHVTERRTSEDYKKVGDIWNEVIAEIEAAQKGEDDSSVPTSFVELDRLTNGLHPGQMIIVAGRPGMGKSTLAMDFCRSAAVKNKMSAAIFSLEMSSSEIVKRLISAEAGVWLSKVNSGDVDDKFWDRVAKAWTRIVDAPLYIDDSPNLSMPEIRAKCRRLKQQANLQLVVVDYLQLMSGSRRAESRQQEVSELSRSLKLLAKELEIPVIAVAQLNRGPEARTDRKPMMSDLRESGSLEQDADVIMLLHRPDRYNEDDRPGEADIIVAKHRNGETRTIPVLFQGHFARFANMAFEPAS